MSAVDAHQFGKICDGVWRDRDTILVQRGILSGEAALMRAVYWRLCKAGGDPGQKVDAYAPLLKELVRQYRTEAAVRAAKT